MSIESARAADIVAAGSELLGNDPYALLDNADDVRQWEHEGKAAELASLRTQEPAALEYHDRITARYNA